MTWATWAFGLSLACAATMALAAAPDDKVGEPAQPYHAPRNRTGQPIIEGPWTSLSLTDLQRPDELKGLVPPPDRVAAFEKLQNDPAALDAHDAEEARKAGKPAPPNVGENETCWSDADMRLARVRGEPRSSFLVDPPDGKLPYRPAAKARVKAAGMAAEKAFDNPEGRPLGERCLSIAAAGPPILNLGFNANIRIVQTPDHVSILTELMHDVRVIRLVAPPRGGVPGPDAGPQTPAWLGRSEGWWEGDTLRVRTTGFLDRAYPSNGIVLSEKAVVEEAFRRTGPHRLYYRFQVVDPVNYDRTWWGEMEFNTAAPNALLEYACHEGNYSLPGILAGARRAEAEAAKAPKSPRPE